MNLDNWDTTDIYLNYPQTIKDIYLKKKFFLRKIYNKWIGEISNKHSRDIDWWVSNVPERNLLNKNIFHYLCLLETLKSCKKRGIKISEIYVDNIKLKEIIKKKFKHSNIRVKEVKKKSFLNLFRIFIYHFLIFIFSKFDNIKLKELNNSSLIDLFLISKKIDSKRYYGSLEKKIGKKKVFFLPIIYNLKIIDLINLIFKINNNKKYLLKEKFLSFKDFFYSASYYFRVNKFNHKYKKILNYDFSSIIYKELKNFNNYASIINGINNYLFFKNLRSNNINLKCILGWFENTSVDKSWNLGSNTFYKNTKSYGYQGFTCYKEFLCLDPIDYEKKYNVLPNKIIVIGKKYENAKKEFTKNIDIVQGPALRFEYMKNNILKPKKNIVLIAFSVDEKVNSNIWNVIVNSQILKKQKVFIKNHPILKDNFFKNKNFPKNFIIKDETFEKLLAKSKILITSGCTSTIIESLACGTYFLTPFNNFFDKFSLKSVKIPQEGYRISNNFKEFEKNLNYLLNQPKFSKSTLLRLKRDYFNINTKVNIIDFLKIL